MTKTAFFRLLAHDDKATALSDRVSALNSAAANVPGTYVADHQSFRQIPGSPFAYWGAEEMQNLFAQLSLFEGNGRAARRGASTGDDFRRVRTWKVAKDYWSELTAGKYQWSSISKQLHSKGVV